MSKAIGYKPGTSVVWISASGDKVILLDNLINGAAAQGDKSNTFLNASGQLPAFIRWRFETAVAAPANNGREVSFHIGQSDHASPGTNNPGNLSGVASNLFNAPEMLGQLDRIGPLILANTRGSNVQRVWLTSYPRSPYQIPVVFNDSGQTLTNSAGVNFIQATPYYQSVETV
jgi:hypothetical protein